MNLYTDPEMLILAAERTDRLRRTADGFRLGRPDTVGGRHRRFFRWPSPRRAPVRHELAS